MRSVADALREEIRRKTAGLSPEARLDLAFALGDEDAAALASAKRLSLDAAKTLIARSRKHGRQPSRCNDE